MSKYFFFTDPTTLEDQTSNEAYGPVLNSDIDSYDTAFDKYRTTSIHRTKAGSTSSVIALCDGSICIQENDDPSSDSLNIIVKPDYQPPFDFPFVAYYIYKGVKRDSLIKSSTNELDESGAISFIEQIRDSWQDPDNDNPIAESADILGIKYTEGQGHEVNGEEIFKSADSIDHFFYYTKSGFELPRIKAGDQIGEFESEFGFDIILRRLGYTPQISLARSQENFISVDVISDPVNDTGIWDGNLDNAEYFKHWHEKEKCLNFMDSCAFYGSFCSVKVFYRDTTKNKTEKCNTPQEIFDSILNRFYNRNKTYIDIRNDYGFSLNYFKDYGDKVRFSDEDGVSESEFKTTRSLWPILQLEYTETASAVLDRNKLSNCFLSISCKNNDQPLVYYSNAYVRRLRKLRRKFRHYFVNNQLEYTERTPISFVSIEDSGNTIFLSQYYKINLYDYKRNDNDQNTLAPSKNHYLNGLFKPLDLIQTIRLREEPFYTTIWNEEVLVNQSSIGGPSFIASIGIAEDDHHITLFAYPYRFIDTGFTNQTPDAFTSFVNNSKESNKMFLQEIFELFKGKEVRKKEMYIDVLGRIEQIDSVVVQHAPFSFLESVFRSNENPEDYVFVMFDKATFSQLQSDLFSTNELLLGWLIQDSATIKLSNNGIKHNEHDLITEYLKLSTSKASIQVSTSQIKIYEDADF